MSDFYDRGGVLRTRAVIQNAFSNLNRLDEVQLAIVAVEYLRHRGYTVTGPDEEA